MKEKDIIVLEGGNKYYLIKKLDFEDEMYFYASAADENNKIIENRNLIFKVINEDDECFIEAVSDKRILSELVKMIKDTIN